MRIVTGQSSSTVDVKKASHNKYYIAQNKSSKALGFVTRSEFDHSTFKLMAINGMTNGNCYGYHIRSSVETLSEFLQGIIYDDVMTVYEFNTPKEMLNWMANNSV